MKLFSFRVLQFRLLTFYLAIKVFDFWMIGFNNYFMWLILIILNFELKDIKV